MTTGSNQMPEKKKRRLTPRQVEKVLVQYNLIGRADAYLATLGSLAWRRPPDLTVAPWEKRINRDPARLRDRVVLTAIGPLGVSVYDDWIACVFDDAKAASGRVSGVDDYNGKWNHHAFVAHCHGPTDPDVMRASLNHTLEDFCRGVERITLGRPLRLWRGTYRPVQLPVWHAAAREAETDPREFMDTAALYTYWHQRAHGGRRYPMDPPAREHWIALGGTIEDSELWDPRR